MLPAAFAAELAAQHAALREMIESCSSLADELDRGATTPLALTAEVARLRGAFDVHSRFEEQELRPAMLAANAFEAVQVDAMIEAHVREHRALGGRLLETETSLLREVIETIRAHLDAEERYLLR
jgi:Hemerythrin HHE cation binding domain